MRHVQTISAFVHYPDRDPNGSIRIFKVGSRVSFDHPFRSTGTVTKITNRSIHVLTDHTKKTLRQPSHWLDLI
jgi:hypothetical protein